MLNFITIKKVLMNQKIDFTAPELVANESYHINFYILGMIVLWTVIIVLVFLFDLVSIKKEFSALARLEAISSFNKDTVYRRWATEHGGTYVPISENMQPNPYLKVKERDITTPSGKKLTLVNPAYMIRQVHELGEK